MDKAPIWTDELLQRLRAAGLRVTRNMIGQDVKAGYLPRPQIQSRRPNRGRAGQWDYFAMRRAFYLYRLRNRSAQGDVLRVLLFLRDGWGWDRIYPVCLKGFRKLVRMWESEVRDHIYSQVTPEILHAEADDISGDALFKHLEIGRFILGMGMFGKPLEGGSLLPLGKLFNEAFRLGTLFPRALAEQAEQIIVSSGLTWEGMIQIVAETDAEQADRARCRLLQIARLVRHWINMHCSHEAVHPCPSNLLTLGGRPAREIAAELRSFRERITPGQLLSAQIGIAVIAIHLAPDEEAIEVENRLDLVEGDIR